MLNVAKFAFYSAPFSEFSQYLFNLIFGQNIEILPIQLFLDLNTEFWGSMIFLQMYYIKLSLDYFHKSTPHKPKNSGAFPL
jgi:hypothetical protein